MVRTMVIGLVALLVLTAVGALFTRVVRTQSYCKQCVSLLNRKDYVLGQTRVWRDEYVSGTALKRKLEKTRGGRCTAHEWVESHRGEHPVLKDGRAMGGIQPACDALTKVWTGRGTERLFEWDPDRAASLVWFYLDVQLREACHADGRKAQCRKAERIIEQLEWKMGLVDDDAIESMWTEAEAFLVSEGFAPRAAAAAGR